MPCKYMLSVVVPTIVLISIHNHQGDSNPHRLPIPSTHSNPNSNFNPNLNPNPNPNPNSNLTLQGKQRVQINKEVSCMLLLSPPSSAPHPIPPLPSSPPPPLPHTHTHTSCRSSAFCLNLVSSELQFWRRLWPLLQVVFPSPTARTSVCLAAHTCFLVARTAISIAIAKLDGMIVRSIVEKKWDDFLLRMGQWLLIAWPACFTNSMIHYLEGSLAEALRTKLTSIICAQGISFVVVFVLLCFFCLFLSFFFLCVRVCRCL